MIAACPKCEARYRVDGSKLGPEGAKLRCAKCQAVFRVRAPQPADANASSMSGTTAPAPPAVETAAPPVAVPPSRTESTEQPVAPPSEESSQDRSRMVLVADPQEERGKQTASALTSWGLVPLLVHDGVEAMMTIQRSMPPIVVLDAALPKMFGFQICEFIKRNESLRATHVVLVGAIHAQERYRRPPTDLYGADSYLEQPDVPDGLKPLFEECGMLTGSTGARVVAPDPGASASAAFERSDPGASASAAFDMPDPGASGSAAFEETDPAASASAAVPAPVAPAEAPVDSASGLDPAMAEEREKAERLARIIVSDIVLYAGDRFEQGIQNGNLLEVLDSQIEEGRKLFRQRIDEAMREESDHLMDELLRVARERGMQ